MKSLTKSELTPQESEFVRLIAVEGRTPSQAASAPEVGISVSTAYRWREKPHIQSEILRILSHNRIGNMVEATKRQQKAWSTIDEAYTNPNITPTQLKAAMFTISLAMGNKGDEEAGGNHITVEVNTSFGSDLVELQKQRAAFMAQQRATVIEGEFTERE